MIKIILIALMSILLANCSQTYKVKQEANVKDNRLLNEVPQWYIDAQIDDGIILNRDADKYIYAVGQGTSPDLQLAIEKATMIAKAALADQLQGEMNQRTELYITEIGSTLTTKLLQKLKAQSSMLLQRQWFKVMKHGKKQYMRHQLVNIESILV